MSRCFILFLLVAGYFPDVVSTDEDAPRSDRRAVSSAAQLTDGFLNAYPQEPIGQPFLEMIRLARGDVHVLVFLGTWCSDSKRDVPRFLRIADGQG